MKKARVMIGVVLLLIAAVPVCEYLFFYQPRPDRMLAEEVVLRQMWFVVSPVFAIVGLALIFWPSRRTQP